MARKPNPFASVRHAANGYTAQLRKIARHIDDLVKQLVPTNMEQSYRLQSLLNDYSKLIEPWARAVGEKMLQDVSHRDMKAWRSYTSKMSKALQNEIRNAPVGLALQDYLASQVVLIKSLPTEAGQRVHDLVLKGMAEGTRQDNIVAEIMRTGDVTRSRAMLIARTECARAASGLTMLRAQAAGSEAYIWHSMLDAATRPTHKAMEGKLIRWDSPPVVDPKYPPFHAGGTFNCRCFSAPILPTD